MDRTPASLLDRMTRGADPAAWERFVRLFTPLLDRWASRLGVSETDRADLIQEVFVILIRRLPGFHYDRDRSFRAWLWTVFRHTALAWKQRQGREPGPLDHVEQIPAPNGPDRVEADFRQYLVGRALAILRADFPAQTWKMFWAVAVTGRSGVDVAREFGTTANAVYLARGRVLSRLRHELAGLDQ